MIRRPPRSTLSSSSAASDVYKRQGINAEYGETSNLTMVAVRSVCLAALYTVWLPYAHGLVVSLAEKTAFISTITPGVENRAQFQIDVVLMLSWDGPACVARGSCSNTTKAPTYVSDYKPYNLPFIVLANAVTETGITTTLLKDIPLSGDTKSQVWKISAKLFAAYDKWRYPFGSVQLELDYLWDKSSYIEGDRFNVEKCAQMFHFANNNKSSIDRGWGEQLPSGWSLDGRCGTNTWVSYGTEQFEDVVTGATDAASCVTRITRPSVEYKSVVRKDYSSLYWFGTWVPIQALIMSQLAGAIMILNGSRDSFEAQTRAYLLGFLALFSKTTYQAGAFDMNTLYMTLCVGTHTSVFLMMGYGVRAWNQFKAAQSEAKRDLATAIEETDFTHSRLTHWPLTRRYREQTRNVAVVEKLLTEMLIPAQTVEQFVAAEVDLHALCGMKNAEFQELGLSVGMRRKVQQKGIAMKADLSKRQTDIIEDDTTTDASDSESKGSIELAKPFIDLALVEESHTEPLTAEEKDEEGAELEAQASGDAENYRQHMATLYKRIMKVWLVVYVIVIFGVIIVMESLPCSFEPQGNDWFSH
eukprot:TRINITY_DN2556_c0_g1_i1.p1 TRINITY_DN2556_c0_g1~~TRINITY_DN2556_c0_g1_i1.p1  ORF type:complete len:585 (+),score=94.58 TRINITY_DN2556_c0_g1_i1:81-1835(+)